MNNLRIIGIDLGGTNIRAGLVNGDDLLDIRAEKIKPAASAEEVVHQLFNVTDQLFNDETAGIGIGVPGLVNEEQGIVFDVVNIPAWTEMPLKRLMEERYQVPI